MTAYNRNTLIVGLAAALVIGGIVSYFASGHPDGLEKTQEDLGAAEAVHEGLDAAPVAFDEYSLKWLPEGFWANAAAGVVGSLLVMGLLLGLGRLLRRKRSAGTAGEPSQGTS
jgi:cobalt/nickel transport protein